MTEFKKVGQRLNKQSQFVQLFRDIDAAKIGSFNFNDLIRYYLNKKLEKEPYRLVYQLMEYKLKTKNLTV